MQRLFRATIPALTLLFALLSSACAPKGNMIATLTQLPYAATPPTWTPGPTVTPRATRTFTPAPPGFESTGAVLTGTYSVRLTSTTSTAVPTETIQHQCIPGVYDESVPGPDTPEQFIGKHYNQTNPPAEIQWLGSGQLDAELNWVHVRVQGQDMYWIQKVACRDDRGQPFWEITDALALPLLNKQANEVVVDLCFSGSRQLANVIAYGTYDPSTPAASVVNNIVGWPVHVISAWQMQERFIPINTRGLTCVLKKQ